MESLAKFFKHDFKNGYFKLFDKNGNRIYYEDSSGHWSKKEYDENNNQIYYESSNGYIVDNRPSCSGKVVEIDGKKYKLEEI